MKKRNGWKPTKFERDTKGNLRASSNPQEVGIASRLMVNFIAAWYDENIKEFAKGKLLDLGCGKAPLYESYSPFVDEIVLADWANSLHENKHLDVVCDITKKLPFKNNSFDTIILSDVMEHIPNPNDVMKEVYRILKPKGVVLMNNPFLYWLHEVPHDYNRYTEFMIRKMIEDNGMQVIKIEAPAGGWAVLIDLTSKLFIQHPKMVNLIQKVGPRLLAKRLKIRAEFPLFYAAVFQKKVQK